MLAMHLNEDCTGSVGWEAKTELTIVCDEARVCAMAMADEVAVSGSGAGGGSLCSPVGRPCGGRVAL